MAYLRDRRAFGNIGTRRFRGARFGDPLSPRFTGLLDQYGGAAAAYSLRALSSGWLAGDVVEVRRSSDSTTQDFTASQITGGQMLDFVNNDTTSLYNSARYFDGASAVVNLTSPITLNSTGDYLELNYFSSVTDRKGIAATAGGAHIDFTSGSASIGIFDDTGASSIASCPIVLNTLTKLRIERAADGSFDVYQNEVLTGSTAILGNVSLNTIGRNRFSASRWNGILTDVDFNNQAAYTGLGTSVTAWEDTIGSNDGTESNGAAYTGQPFDGFVSTWYDQSGNANDAVQATTTSQPKIVDAGVLVTEGGKPAFNIDGVDDKFDLSSTITNVGDFYISLVSVLEETSGLQTILGANTNSDYLRASDSSWQLYTETGAGDTGSVSWSATFDSRYLMSFNRSGSTVTAQLNSSSAGTGTNGTDISFITKLFQRSTNTTQLWKGNFQEMIFYTSDQSANRAAIEANINDHYSIY